MYFWINVEPSLMPYSLPSLHLIKKKPIRLWIYFSIRLRHVSCNEGDAVMQGVWFLLFTTIE